MESVGNGASSELEATVDATVELDDVIKTKIASSDVSVYIVPPGAIFAEGAMVGEFGKGGESHVVAGAVEIGLLRKSGNVEKVLRKPEVVPERDLFEHELDKNEE